MNQNLNNKYRITVKPIIGPVLTFFVEDYSIEDSCFLKFFDKKTESVQRFAATNCEIKEVKY
jgi:hypothetical protein